MAPVEGTVANGGSTNDTTPTLSGTAEAGSTVTIYQNETDVGTTTKSETEPGTFTFLSVSSPRTATILHGDGHRCGRQCECAVEHLHDHPRHRCADAASSLTTSRRTRRSTRPKLAVPLRVPARRRRRAGGRGRLDGEQRELHRPGWDRTANGVRHCCGRQRLRLMMTAAFLARDGHRRGRQRRRDGRPRLYARYRGARRTDY